MTRRIWGFAALAAFAGGTSQAQQGEMITEAEFRNAVVACMEQVSQSAGRARPRADLLALAACLEDKGRAQAAREPEILSNDDIIELTNAGWSASRIVSRIREGQNNFDTSVQQVLRLAQAGVDTSVIEAMQDAMANATYEQRAAGPAAPDFSTRDTRGGIQRTTDRAISATRRPRDAMNPFSEFVDRLRSGGAGPDMVVIPAGRFEMGCVAGGCRSDERPVHTVMFSRPFAISKHEVTFAQWDACVAAGGCGIYRPDDNAWGRGNRPVINVNLRDIESYLNWLSRETDERYRLPSEAEWEYAARGGSQTRYPWGNSIRRNRANCKVCGSSWDDQDTAPVGSFAPNSYGLHDMHGNVWEWVADCWNRSYSRAPADGSSWMRGDCSRRVLRGGSWSNNASALRSANRNENTAETRSNSLGFRVARDVSR